MATSYSDRLVHLVGDGFDAAIRLGELKDSSLVARRISPVRSALVASPPTSPAPERRRARRTSSGTRRFRTATRRGGSS
ncbi:hypothetical protein JM664_08355 [Rhodobacteraceae bacterium MCCB 386]|nr:hypothetical protein [Roseitranquillus sediminis]